MSCARLWEPHVQRPYDLSSINALICFEAAARNLSFKTAAQEMNVTPAAISHQIKALETDLGISLFTRRNRGVELTEKGAYLLFALQRGFKRYQTQSRSCAINPKPLTSPSAPQQRSAHCG